MRHACIPPKLYAPSWDPNFHTKCIRIQELAFIFPKNVQGVTPDPTGEEVAVTPSHTAFRIMFFYFPLQLQDNQPWNPPDLLALQASLGVFSSLSICIWPAAVSVLFYVARNLKV